MKRSHIQQTSIEVTVGAFMVMVLLALGFFTIILSRENLFMRNYRADVVFSDVSGLIKGDKAYMHGVDVGRVKNMRIEPDGVHIVLSLRYDLDLREDYKIAVVPTSILGGRYVSIDSGSADKPKVPPGAVLRGTPPDDLIGEATAAIKKVRQSFEEGGVLHNLEGTMDNLREITDGLKKGEGTAGKLFKDEQLYDNLKEVTASLKNLSQKLERGEGTLGKLMAEDKVYKDLESITDNLKQVSDRLAKGQGTLGKLMAGDDRLYQDLTEASKSIKEIADGINRGEGTLGKLTKDEELYQQLNKLVGEIRAAVDDIRETSPATSLSSVFFGAF